jgi:hypothetical protein
MMLSLKKQECGEGVDWIYLTRSKVQQLPRMNTVLLLDP